ncbi:MAG: ATP-binding protein [Myxococcota bacterium]|nr:ATP-binding protein [Myxococcota bacterium]
MGEETEEATRVLARSNNRDPRPDPSGPIDSHGPAESDLPKLIEGAIRELARRVHGSSLGAWWGRADSGTPECLVSQRPGPDPIEPLGANLFAALAKLAQPTDLGARSADPELLLFAKRSGCSAAIAIGPTEETSAQAHPRVLVLAVGSETDPPGAVRPRTLAALTEAREKLRAAFGHLSAMHRLGRLDESIENLDRRAALGELVAEIVHEVRNPLVSVKTFLELLPSRLDDTDFVEGFREVVIGEVGRLERLLDTVLRQARPGSRESAADPADVTETFERVRRLVSHRAQERQIQIEHPTPLALPNVALPSDALDQIVLNLVLNALDAVPPGGRIDMKASAHPESNEIEIRIEDDGPGIPTHDRQRIFEHFHSTRSDRPGGLGLSISQRLAQASGGNIEADESPAGGACLRLRLPVDTQPR